MYQNVRFTGGLSLKCMSLCFLLQVIDVLSKLAGLWVNAKNEIMYSQASQITFICPMIFNYFPLDTQVFTTYLPNYLLDNYLVTMY